MPNWEISSSYEDAFLKILAVRYNSIVVDELVVETALVWPPAAEEKVELTSPTKFRRLNVELESEPQLMKYLSGRV